MEAIASYDHSSSALEDPKQFWNEVEDVLQKDVKGSIDLATSLASFYALCDACYDEHLDDQRHADYVLHRLLSSSLISSASVEECAVALSSLAVSATSLPSLLLLYETLLKLSNRHSSFFRLCPTSTLLIPRLVHHFWAARYAEEYNLRRGAKGKVNEESVEDDAGEWNVKHIRSASRGNVGKEKVDTRNRNVQIRLRELAIVLLYEISRSHRLTHQEMRAIDATFIDHLFELVEQSRNWHDDAYNYNLIKLIVSLNEQFMVSGISAASAKPAARKSTASASNTVLTVLRTRLNASKTFGENVIFMLNRASSLDAEDICMQLLILKLLYLLFTTRETAHYFYTNDLKVLVDIFVRELSDLPDDLESLRHTYLRVLHPLLTNTQLLSYPYKRKQIQSLLHGLTSHGHLRDISSTTQRLVDRCLSAQWCVDLEQVTASPSVPSMKAGKEGKQGDSHKHTFAVQSIGGGQAKIVEAQAVVDSEGISIPVHGITDDSSHSSPHSTMDVPASPQESSPQVLVDAASTEKQSEQSAGLEEMQLMRTSRIRSVDGLPSRVRSSLHGLSAGPMSDDGYTAKRDVIVQPPQSQSMLDAIGSSDSALTAKERYLHTGLQRNVHDAKRAMFAKRVHSALDVSKLAEDDNETSENESEQWIGSPNGSWHQSMAVEPRVLGTRRRAGTGNSLVSSPLRDDAYQSSLDDRLCTTTNVNDSSSDVACARPALHVQEPSTDDTREGQSMSGSGIMRRRPPAPPSARSDSGEGPSKWTKTQANNALQPSFPYPSPIPNIALSDDHEDDSSNHGERRRLMSGPSSTDRMLRVASTPVSPGSVSRSESRSNSPLPEGALTPSSTSARRRRPPPPPVDRSTKVVRSSTPSAAAVATAFAYENDNVASREADDPIAAVARAQEQQHLSRYMNHLHLSGNNGYGW